MVWRRLTAIAVLPALVFAACGEDKDKVDVATYTCAQFNKSLRTKDDNTAGRYINELRKRANLSQEEKTERQNVTLGIYFTCRGKPGTTKPATGAVKVARQLKNRTFKAPPPKKKSSK